MKGADVGSSGTFAELSTSVIFVEIGDDTLLERLRERARDPLRRKDAQPSRFDQSVSGLSAGELRLGVASTAGALTQLVDSIQSGSPVDDAIHTRARQIQVDMSTPADAPPLAPPMTEAVLDDVQSQLGVPLPDFLRRVYLEVADGGFGPGSGLLSAGELLKTYRHLKSSPPDETEADDWPDGLLPLVQADEAYYCCLDTSTGRILETDYDETEDDGEIIYRMVLCEIAPSLRAWLTAWLDAAPAGSMSQVALLHDSMIEAARTARAHIATMTPEQRAEMGLPEHGWEQIVWGGIGLETDSV